MKTLLVPMHLDALCLKEPTAVRNPTADFSKIPYCDAQRDVHGDLPPVSESILSDPFEAPNLTLPAGIHLHWALPAGLMRGEQTEQGIDFRTVPNRWLVTRMDPAGQVQKQWVVESDYLHPEHAESNAVIVPYSPREKQGECAPFRHMGRQVPLELYKCVESSGQYVPRLTAVGFEPNIRLKDTPKKDFPTLSFGWSEYENQTIYREPLFSAYYPNCYSIFGAFDASADPEKNYTYEVLGWYADEQQDPLQEITHTDTEKFRTALRERYGWTLPEDENSTPPQRLICFSRITLTGGHYTEHPEKQADISGIAVADSSVEALSALLAEKIDPPRRDQIEEQLDVLMLQDHLQNEKLDLTARIRETRHNARFDPVRAGTHWEIRLDTKTTTPTADKEADQTADPELPPETKSLLKQVNQLQRDYDTLSERIRSRQVRCFDDWYKYLLCAYRPMESRFDLPDADVVRFFMNRRDITPLEQELAARGKLTKHHSGSLSSEGASDCIAVRLHQTLNELTQHLATLNTAQTDTTYALRNIPQPRYWKPSEPTLVVESKSFTKVDRYTRTNLLVTIPWESAVGSPQETMLASSSIRDFITTLKPRKSELGWSNSAPFRDCAHQPWNPLLLDWQVRVYPLLNNQDGSGNFHGNLVDRNYQLELNRNDLSEKEIRAPLTPSASTCSGTAILSPSSAGHVRKTAEAFVKKYADSPQTSSATETIRKALDILNSTGFLAQKLGGFNDALLMHRRTMQVPTCEPVAFKNPATHAPPEFVERLKKVLDTQQILAPQPLNDFIPLRSGGMRINDLCLIDNFGQTQPILPGKVQHPVRMHDPDNPLLARFSPRIVQPMQLSFRWLSGRPGNQESTLDAETSPLCGWLLVNNFGSRLMVYDQDGHALGSLASGPTNKAKWIPAPGPGRKTAASNEIANPYLRQVVAFIEGKSERFLNEFLDALENSLETIEPMAEMSDSLSLLVGRPIAVVRASLNLKLEGLAAINLEWSALRNDLQAAERTTNAFTHIQFPIRIGETDQLGDGLIGYWLESKNGFADQIFNSTQQKSSSYLVEDSKIKTQEKAQALNLLQTISDPAQLLTLLIDPRGSVRATSGILPVKTIALPPNLYTSALENLYITFQLAPLLSDPLRMRLPLPEASGFTWSWLEKQTQDDDKWLEVPVIQLIEKSTFATKLREADDTLTEKMADNLWTALNQEDPGWLKPLPPEQSMEGQWSAITAKDQRKSKKLPSEFTIKPQLVQRVFDENYIGLKEETLRADFTGPKILREGWLKLAPAQ